MKAIDYLKEKARMTNNCDTCDECPLDIEKNEKNLTCVKLEGNDPVKAVEIVEKWAKEHPPKTYLSVLLEKFPYTKMIYDGLPKYCPRDLFNIDRVCPKKLCKDWTCKDCWNRECEEVENE